MIVTRVAGTSYYSTAVYWVKPGDAVELIPEPDCPYDPDAVRVFHK